MAVSDSASKRARRGPAPSLDMDQILMAALRLLDRDGAKAFNMRALAAELGSSAMTVYNYVPTKAALLEAVIDRVLEDIAPPSPDAERWDDELRRYARQAWAVQAPHTWLAALLVEQHIVDRPAQAASRQALKALFRRAGADDATALELVAAFFSFMIGSFMQVRLTAKRAVPARADALFDAGIEILLAGLRSRLERCS
jgi:AcrR family transcriptional regulator